MDHTQKGRDRSDHVIDYVVSLYLDILFERQRVDSAMFRKFIRAYIPNEQIWCKLLFSLSGKLHNGFQMENLHQTWLILIVNVKVMHILMANILEIVTDRKKLLLDRIEAVLMYTILRCVLQIMNTLNNIFNYE